MSATLLERAATPDPPATDPARAHAHPLVTSVVVAVLVTVALALALSFDGGGADESPGAVVELGAVVAAWPSTFELTGTKGVETWVEHVNVRRDGSVFVLTGGAPRGEVQQVRTVEVVDDRLVESPCPTGGAACTVEPTVGFLSTAAAVAALAAAPLRTDLPVLEYAGRPVVCPAARLLGIDRAALDPCFDLATGAVLAQRHPTTGEFDGPSLDPWSVAVSTPGSSGTPPA